MSKNREDPFNSRSPGAARGVNIHQTLKPNSRSFSIILACPVSSSAISAFFPPRRPTVEDEAHRAGLMRDLSPHWKNVAIGYTLLRRSSVPWDASLTPFKSSAMSPQFNTWLGRYSDCKPAFNSNAFPKSCFITEGTSSQKTHVLSLGYSAVNVQSFYKSVQHPPPLSFCLLVSTALPLGAHGLCAPGTARSTPHWSLTLELDTLAQNPDRCGKGSSERGRKKESEGKESRGELGSQAEYD